MASAEEISPSPQVAANSGISRSPAAAQKPPMLAELKVRIHIELGVVVLYFLLVIALINNTYVNRNSASPRVCHREGYLELENGLCLLRQRTVSAQVRNFFLSFETMSLVRVLSILTWTHVIFKSDQGVKFIVGIP